MNHQHRTLAALLIPGVLCTSSIPALAGPPEPTPILTTPSADGWDFRITPYAWLTALDGTSGPSASPADVDASFSDIADVLEMAAALQLEARHGRWGILADGFYSELGMSGTAPGPAEIDVDLGIKQFIGELELLYRFSDCPTHFIDVYAGFRYTNLSLDLEFEGTGPLGADRKVSADRDWVDPIVGLRTQWIFNDRWFLAGKGDIGGFGVSSDFTWNIQGTFGYYFTPSFSTEIGYRYFDMDYEEDNFIYDMAQAGLLLNFNFEF